MWRQRHHSDAAKWVVRHPESPSVTQAKLNWARRTLGLGGPDKKGNGPAGQRWIREGSKTYKVLESAGLLEKLPAEIGIKGYLEESPDA